MDRTTFFGLPFSTAPGRVMTPRAASERLVELAAERIGSADARVADIGTGSGAIAVALALAAPEAEVWATDISAESVLLARANAPTPPDRHRCLHAGWRLDRFLREQRVVGESAFVALQGDLCQLLVVGTTPRHRARRRGRKRLRVHRAIELIARDGDRIQDQIAREVEHRAQQ